MRKKETYNTGWRDSGDTQFVVAVVVLVQQICITLAPFRRRDLNGQTRKKTHTHTHTLGDHLINTETKGNNQFQSNNNNTRMHINIDFDPINQDPENLKPLQNNPDH